MLGVDFFDELAGIAFLAAPDLQVTFGLRYGTAAFVLFVLPQLASLLLEPPLLLLAHRLPRKPLVVGGLAMLGASLVAAGLATGGVSFAVAFALAAPASGVGVNLAQTTLVDANPDQRERILARWAFMGGLGDLSAPALSAVLASLALGWRAAFVAVGLLTALYALTLLPFGFPTRARLHEGERDEPAPLKDSIRAALHNRSLVAWLFGASLCGLLDEVLVAFAALHLEELGASAGERSLVLGGFVVGSLAGLVASERLLRRHDPLQLLRWSSLLCGACYGAWLLSSSLPSSALWLAVTGCFASPLYPIAKAQAYRALPESSALVVAGAQLLAPLELALPLVLGLAADALGLRFALALLLLQPLGLLALATLPRRHPD